MFEFMCLSGVNGLKKNSKSLKLKFLASCITKKDPLDDATVAFLNQFTCMLGFIATPCGKCDANKENKVN